MRNLKNLFSSFVNYIKHKLAAFFQPKKIIKTPEKKEAEEADVYSTEEQVQKSTWYIQKKWTAVRGRIAMWQNPEIKSKSEPKEIQKEEGENNKDEQIREINSRFPF